MLGGSDAGAHLDRMCGAPYTTRFLGDCLRGRKLGPLERAVQMITDEPARALRPARPRPCSPRASTPTSSCSTPRPSAPSRATLVARPAGRHRPAHRRRHRRRARVRERRRDRRRQRAHRRAPRHRPALRPRHRHRPALNHPPHPSRLAGETRAMAASPPAVRWATRSGRPSRGACRSCSGVSRRRAHRARCAPSCSVPVYGNGPNRS